MAGRNHWMHTAATTRLTAYYIDEHGRGTEAIKAFGILPRFTGVAVHDAYKGDDGFTGCVHALCNANVVRELTGMQRAQRRRPRRRLGRPDDRPARRRLPLDRRLESPGPLRAAGLQG